MAISPRLIRRRIKSVRATRKIMKAMEMVAASKMRKATALTLGTRPYALLIRELTQHVRRLTDPRAYAWLVGSVPDKGRPLRTLAVIAASDRGLCGGFNSQLIKKSLEFLQHRPQDRIELVTVGRRAAQVARRGRFSIFASFDAISNAASSGRAKPIADLVVQEFVSGRADRVFLLFMQFQSAMIQVPAIEQLLPIIPEEEIMDFGLQEVEKGETGAEQAAALFEPSPDVVLRSLLPREVEMRLYQALLESTASEHAARMMAMRSAGDAAGEMLEDFTLALNQARQGAITREISEISAGKAAIES